MPTKLLQNSNRTHKDMNVADFGLLPTLSFGIYKVSLFLFSKRTQINSIGNSIGFRDAEFFDALTKSTTKIDERRIVFLLLLGKFATDDAGICARGTLKTSRDKSVCRFLQQEAICTHHLWFLKELKMYVFTT